MRGLATEGMARTQEGTLVSVWRRLWAADGKPAKRPAAGDPWEAAAHETRPGTLHDGFDPVRRAPRGAAWWMWSKRLAVGMLLLAGFIQLVIKPVRNVLADEQPPAAPAAVISVQAAGATATGFAVDYLSTGGPSWDPHRAAALEQWLYPGSFGQASDVGVWDGDAVLLADSASVQDVHQVSEDAAVVAVQVRVRTFLPDGAGGAGTSQPPAPPEQESAAFVPPVPAGYTAGPAYWMRLVVPVLQAGDRPRVTAPGPVFSADDITPVSVSIESDARQNAQLAPAAEKIVAAYATGDLQYVASAPELVGMDGALVPNSVTAVRVSAISEPDGARPVAAEVQWRLAGTTAAITQTYGLALSEIDSAAPQLERLSVLTPTHPDTDENENENLGE